MDRWINELIVLAAGPAVSGAPPKASPWLTQQLAELSRDDRAQAAAGGSGRGRPLSALAALDGR